jgi:uncharacterized membrane protein
MIPRASLPLPAARLSRGDRAIGFIPWALGALFGAAALHLLAVLALPALSPNASYRTLAIGLPLGDKAALPRAAAGVQGPPFADPFAALAVCRFDLNEGPLRLRAAADGDHPFSVSVRLADGTIIYSGNDRQTPHGRFNVLIVTQAQADAQDSAEDSSDSQTTDDVLRLVSPGRKGFALFRAMSLREGDYEDAAAARTGVTCNIEKSAP